MLTTSRRILKNRGQRILDLQKRKKIKDLGIKLVESEVEAGSGSLPEDKIESMALSFKPKSMKITELAGGFRCGSIPVVGYTSGNTFYIDLKAVLPGQINRLAKAIDQV